jgi:iron(III) transport system ATP-binding protein
VTVLVRPEQLVLGPPPPDGGDSRAAGHVVRHDFHGHDILTLVRLADGTELLARRLNTGAIAEPGAPVTVRIEGAVHAWERTG